MTNVNYRPAIRGVVDDLCHLLGIDKDKVLSVLVMPTNVVVRFSDDTLKSYRW